MSLSEKHWSGLSGRGGCLLSSNALTDLRVELLDALNVGLEALVQVLDGGHLGLLVVALLHPVSVKIFFCIPNYVIAELAPCTTWL